VWTYELSVPDDTPEDELEGYRELAIATWRTGAECMGGHPGEATATLVDVSPDSEALHRTGAEPTVSSRVWRVEGQVS
jgi:hypothetical protein